MDSKGEEFVSLDPEDFTVEDEDTPKDNENDGILIDGLIGPGLTVIGSESPSERYILQEQMAVSVASGKKFLGRRDTIECGVLLVSHGIADYKETKMRIDKMGMPSKQLEIKEGWPRIDQKNYSGLDCISKLEHYKKKHQDFRLVFLGNFNEILSPFSSWYKEYQKVLNEHKGSIDVITKQNLIRKMEVENVKKLKDFAIKQGVSVVIGDDLNTKNRLYSWSSLRYRHNEIHLRKVSGKYKLEVLGLSAYVPTNKCSMAYNEAEKHFYSENVLKRMNEKPGGKNMGTLSLTAKERTIIDSMWDEGIMTCGEIEKKSDVSHSTVYQKLKMLETPKKGEWVIRLCDNPLTYIADTTKLRDWVN